MSKTTAAEARAIAAEATAAADRLRALLPAGTIVYTNLRHVAPSGMSRIISLHVVDASGGIRSVTGDAARVLGWNTGETRTSGWGLRVNGSGMDMGFHTVYTLASVLYGNGYALEQRAL